MRYLVVILILMTGLVHARSQDYVLKTCKKIYKGDCVLVASIAYHESKYRPGAFNPEGSYGLMQIKCTTARGIGFKADCSKLFEPIENMRWAIKYIETKNKKFTRFTDVIASYNSGTPIICRDHNPGKCLPGEYYNQAYVDKVLMKYMVLKLSLNQKIYLATYP